MLKKISVIFSLLSLSLILANCSTGQINTVAESNSGFKEATINLNNVDTDEIYEVQIDGKTLSTQDYSSDNNQLNFSRLEPGKHIVKFKHKKYGYTDVPIDVRNDSKNNYQLNAVIEGDAINDWELGIDANNDGIIDNDSFLSRPVEGYVVVREFSGTTNYLPKQNFADDYRREKLYPNAPPDFQFPDSIGPQPGRGQKPVFMPQDPNLEDRSGQIITSGSLNMRPPKPDMPAPSKVNIPFPNKLATYKIDAIFIGDNLLPPNGYLKKNDSLIFRVEILKGNNVIIKVYLIDETGQGVLLSINPKRPIFNENNQINREIFLGEEDLDYSLENNIKIEPEKIEQLRHDLQIGLKIPQNKLPFQPGHPANKAPNGKVLPVFSKENGNMTMGSVVGNKYVKIDENGEIVEYTNTVPAENQQDVSLGI